MTEVVGHIGAELEIETASFKRDLTDAQKHLDSNAAAMNKSLAAMEKSFQSLNTFVGAYIGLHLAHAFEESVEGALKFADALKENAAAAGVSTTAYQQFQFAATQTGGSAEKLALGLQNFNKVIGAAAAGSDEAVKALKKVGISVDELKSKSVEQLFEKAENAISKMGGASERAIVQQELFSKAARNSGTSFAQSAEALHKFKEEALASGAVLSSDSIEHAKKAADEFEKLSQVIKVQLMDAFIQWSPWLIKSAEFLKDLGEMSGWAARQLGLLSASTNDQAYDDLLKKRMDTVERLRDLQRGAAQGGEESLFGAGASEEIAQQTQQLAELDKALAALREKMAKAKTDAAAPTPAVTGNIEITASQKQAADDYNKMLLQGAEQQQAADAADLDRATKHAEELKKINQTPLEAEAELYRQRKGMIAEMEAFEIGTAEERARLEQEVEIAHQAAMGDISAQGVIERRKFMEMNSMQQTQFVLGQMLSLTNGVAAHNKTMFEINKVAGIANAIVNTALGVTKALSSYPPPLSFVMAAVQLAAGMAQVQQIKAAQFGSSSSAASVGGGSAAPTTSADPGGGANASATLATPPEMAKPQRQVTFILKGEGAPSDEYVRDKLMPAVGEALGDGVALTVR